MLFIDCIVRFIKNPFYYLRTPARTIKIAIKVLTGATTNAKNPHEEENSLQQKIKQIYIVSTERENIIKVKRGPFEGMIYPAFESTGSSLFPKLAGVYEKEIQSVIYEVLNANKKGAGYKFFIDVGCAEGYYSVGFAIEAKRNKAFEKILAFDIDPNAHRLCTQMCIANNCNNLVDLKKICNAETLKNIDFSGEKKSFRLCLYALRTTMHSTAKSVFFGHFWKGRSCLLKKRSQ